MALIRCGECRREISDRAHACPHCGCPVPSNTGAGASSRLDELIRAKSGRLYPLPADDMRFDSFPRRRRRRSSAVKLIVIFAVLAVVIAAGIFAFVNLFLNKLNESESILAYTCSKTYNSMKNPASFELRDAWITDKYSVVLEVGGTNSYGGIISNYWYFTYSSEKDDWSLYISISDFEEENVYSWDDVYDRLEKALENAAKNTVLDIIRTDSYKSNKSSIKKVQKLFAKGAPEDIKKPKVKLPASDAENLSATAPKTEADIPAAEPPEGTGEWFREVGNCIAISLFLSDGGEFDFRILSIDGRNFKGEYTIEGNSVICGESEFYAEDGNLIMRDDDGNSFAFVRRGGTAPEFTGEWLCAFSDGIGVTLNLGADRNYILDFEYSGKDSDGEYEYKDGKFLCVNGSFKAEFQYDGQNDALIFNGLPLYRQ